MSADAIYKAAFEIGQNTRLCLSDKELSAEAVRICDAVRARQDAGDCQTYARGYRDGYALRIYAPQLA